MGVSADAGMAVGVSLASSLSSVAVDDVIVVRKHSVDSIGTAVDDGVCHL